MRFFKVVLLLSLLVSYFARPGLAEESGTSWMRTRTLANVLNPNLSVIADMTANSGPMNDAKSNRLSLRETEIGFQASVDPYARADFFVALPEGEAVELEEGYVTLLSLPWGLRARGGKFLANFGRMNIIHGHELPQVDRPLVLSSFLGEEGLNDAGAEVSRVFSPFGVFAEVSYGVLNGLGKAETPEAVTTTVTDTSGNNVTVAVHRPAASGAQRTARNFAQVGRVRLYQDLTDTMNFEIGASGVLHQPKAQKHTKMGGVDFTFRWKPARQGTYRSFIWRTEALYSERLLTPETSLLTGAMTSDQQTLHRRGAYTYAEFQPLQRWRFGVRGDYVEAPEKANESFTYPDGSSRSAESSITRAVTPYITFTLSEFNRFRLQYQHRTTPNGGEEHRVFGQWTVILGPHGAHAF